VADVARKQAALQKERSAGVRWALEQAEIARSWAETSREQMELELQAADTAWTVAAQQETAAVSARQLATTELEEARAAQLAAVAEREEAAATGVAAKMEAEDLEHARAILDLQVAQHATSQTALAQAQSEALRLEQLAKDLAEHSYPPSLLDPDDVISSYVNEDVEPCREDDLDDDRPVAAMRASNIAYIWLPCNAWLSDTLGGSYRGQVRLWWSY
jgi:predicted nucleotide-binding protein